MTNKEIQQLINKYLGQAISLMLGELTMGEAEYDNIMEQRKEKERKPSALLVAIRTISSMAAIYLVGLFFWLQQTPELKTETAYNPGKPTPTTTSYCTEGTPREILACYLEHRQAQPDTYKQLKRMNYEDQ